jgi:hypothetical protein
MDGIKYNYPTAFMPPFPFFIWLALFKIFGISAAALSTFTILNCILSAILIYQTARIAWYFFHNSTVSILSAALITCHPMFVISAATYHATQIYMVPFLCFILLSLSQPQPGWKKAIQMGILGGLIALCRTEYIVLMVPFYLTFFLPRKKLSQLALSIVISAAIVLPWTARNYFVFHRFIPIANYTGLNFLKGFNELANGSGDTVEWKGLVKLVSKKLSSIEFNKNIESTVDDIFMEHALNFMKNEPAKSFLWLPLKKELLFWTFNYHDPRTWHPIYQAAFWPFFIFSILGLILARRNKTVSKDKWMKLIGFFSLQALVIAMYAVHIRYRMNVEPFLFPFAAYALSLIYKKIKLLKES